MKIAVSASGPYLNSPVDPRFGRCQYLTIVDTDTMGFEAVPNPAANAAGGAGIQAAQMVVQKDVEMVLTGRCGPNASEVFEASGVPITTGVDGTVEDAAKRCAKGELYPNALPGTGPGQGRMRGESRVGKRMWSNRRRRSIR
jgi:predicted Fe-Mo cluster-binding NifX family protein